MIDWEKIFEEVKQAQNVTAVCKKYSITRQSYYIMVKRFKQDGKNGLKHRRIGKKYEYKLTKELKDKIIHLVTANPSYSSRIIEKLLLQKDNPNEKISRTTIQTVLNSHGYGTLKNRWLKYGDYCSANGIELNDDEIKKIIKYDPNFKPATLTKDRKKYLKTIFYDFYMKFKFSIQRRKSIENQLKYICQKNPTGFHKYKKNSDDPTHVYLKKLLQIEKDKNDPLLLFKPKGIK